MELLKKHRIAFSMKGLFYSLGMFVLLSAFFSLAGCCKDEVSEEIPVIPNEEKNTVHVKKDGTGDFISIQEAIDSITDASKDKIYDVLIYDDWEVDNVDDLKTKNNWYYLFSTKDYVNVRGVGDKRVVVSVKLPNDVSILHLVRTQTVWFDGNSTLENLDVRLTNGRYPVHSDSKVNENCVQKIKNCKMLHYGNQDADNFTSFQSDYALGLGTWSGQSFIVEDCELIARHQAAVWHTNSLFDKPSKLEVRNTETISQDGFRSWEITELGSAQKNTALFENCSFQGNVDRGAGWYLNGTNRNDASTLLIDVSAVNCTNFRLVTASFGEVLQFSGCVVTGGSARELIYGAGSGKGQQHGEIELSEKDQYNSGYISALGNRLGDCTKHPKTLNISGAIEATIVFDENYGGDPQKPPLIANANIIAGINKQLSSKICSIIYISLISDTLEPKE
jgi:hypothetical protein